MTLGTTLATAAHVWGRSGLQNFCGGSGMATILIDGQEFKVGPELKVGRVLAAACLRFAAPGDVHRFKLFDEAGNELAMGDVVGTRKLRLWDTHNGAIPEVHRRNGASK